MLFSSKYYNAMSLPEAMRIVFNNMKLRTCIGCRKSRTSDSLKVQNLMGRVGEMYRVVWSHPYCLLGAALQVLFPEVCLEFVLEKAHWNSLRQGSHLNSSDQNLHLCPWHSHLATQTSPDVKQTNHSDSLTEACSKLPSIT